MKDYDVIGIGVCAFDLVIEVERYPGADEKLRAGRIRQQGGGLVGTALVAVARLGGTCAYLPPLGNDSFGDFCVREFEREGVDTSLIGRPDDWSVLVAVIVADSAAGTRMICWSDERMPQLDPADVDEEVIRRARVLHVDNFQPLGALRAAELARGLGVPVTMDLEWQDEHIERFLSLGDHIIVPTVFTRDRYGVEGIEKGARALLEEMAPHGGRVAVVTGGTDGSFAAWAGGELWQPAYRVDVVDTTGCGDVFHGAFALGVARGWELDRIMPFASAAAALKCRRLGGRAGIPTEGELERFLRTAEPLR